MRDPVPLPETNVDQLPDPLTDAISVLDVREPDEWAAGHIPGAVHVPLGDVSMKAHLVPAGKVLVVCKVGGRSARATAYLARTGADVVNLQGGLLEWARAGRPLISETGGEPQVI